MISSSNNKLLLLAAGIRGRNKKLFFTDGQGSFVSVSAVETIEAKLREALLSSVNSEAGDDSYVCSCYAATVALSICSKLQT